MIAIIAMYDMSAKTSQILDNSTANETASSG